METLAILLKDRIFDIDSLKLESNKLGDANIIILLEALRESSNRRLMVLGLNNNEVTDGAGQVVAEVLEENVCRLSHVSL